MKSLSVIVPVYNSARYIKTCVESILLQSYPVTEVLLVDDGSEDDSLSVCEDLKNSHSNISLIKNTHLGVAKARNIGIENAKGEFIGFVDADDIVDPHMYEKLINALEDQSADMAICNIVSMDESLTEEISRTEMEEQTLKGKETLPYLDSFYGWCYVSPCNKVYKKSVFSNVKYPEGKIHEDEYAAHRIFLNCSCVSVISDSLYKYRQHDLSIMHSKTAEDTLNGFEAVYNRFVDYENMGYKDLLRGTLEHSKFFLAYIKDIDSATDREKKELVDAGKKFRYMVRKSGNPGLKNRIISANPYLYYRIRGKY